MSERRVMGVWGEQGAHRGMEHRGQYTWGGGLLEVGGLMRTPGKLGCNLRVTMDTTTHAQSMRWSNIDNIAQSSLQRLLLLVVNVWIEEKYGKVYLNYDIYSLQSLKITFTYTKHICVDYE